MVLLNINYLESPEQLPMSPLEKVNNGTCALAVMAKAPLPGKVKTRMCPPLTPHEAAKLNKCFLRDIGESITAASKLIPAQGVVVFAPAGSEKSFDGLFSPAFLFVLQRGDSLEERVIAAGEDLLGAGFASVCLINSDSPSVPPEMFAQAAKILNSGDADIVVGPAKDGGYYLIGFKQMYSRLFHEIEWSTSRVLAQTRERASELNLSVSLLPPYTDVDDFKSLQELHAELIETRRSGKKKSVACHTEAFLADLMPRLQNERRIDSL